MCVWDTESLLPYIVKREMTPGIEHTSDMGLVLEGGGMRGIFTIGVLDAFMESGLWFPYVDRKSTRLNSSHS